MRVHVIPAGDGKGRVLCNLTLEDGREQSDAKNLLSSLGAFQITCETGFFTWTLVADEERYVELTYDERGPTKRWGLSHRALDAGASEALLNLLRGYDTDQGPLLTVRLSELPKSIPRAPERDMPFEVNWDPPIELGYQPVIRIEFQASLGETQPWFRALRAWEHLAAHKAFANTQPVEEPKESRTGPHSSELFMLAPSTLEYDLYGVELSPAALGALLRFVRAQSREGIRVLSVELQP